MQSRIKKSETPRISREMTAGICAYNLEDQGNVRGYNSSPLIGKFEPRTLSPKLLRRSTEPKSIP